MKGDIKSVARLLLRHLPRLDLYGGAVRSDPARYPKSHVGAVVSLICFGAAITLVVVNAMRLYNVVVAPIDDGAANFVSMGTEYVKFNSFIRDPETGELTGAADGRWDLPSLIIETSSAIEFFNRDARKLYKIELRDNNGNHRGLTSSKSATPVASGLYKKLSVSRGTQNPDLNPSSQDQQLGVTLAASLGFKELHSGEEILRVLKNMKNESKDFFDHTAHAYVRMLPWQMQSVKSCQLQVWLANQGQYAAMQEAGLLSEEGNFARSSFTTFATSPSTWRPDNYGTAPPFGWTEKHVTVLKLSASLTRADIARFRSRVPRADKVTDGELMDWRVEFSYVNNFVRVIDAFTCGGRSFDRKYASVTKTTASSSAVLPDLNSSQIILDAPAAGTASDSLANGTLVWPIPPFEVLLTLEDQVEVAKVTAVTNRGDGRQELKLSRKAPVNFRVPGGVFPGDWQCPMKWYNDSKNCNCECGAPDPDCAPGKELPVLGCPMPYTKMDMGSFCSITGRCVKEPPTSTDVVLSVSQGCAEIATPGDVMRTGFVGTSAEFEAAAPGGCVPCPGDVVYEGQVTLDSDKRWKCHVQTSGNVHSDTNAALEDRMQGHLAQFSRGNASANASCGLFSDTWQECMQSDTATVAAGIFVRFARSGMGFPRISPASPRPTPVLVEILLGEAVTYRGTILLAEAPRESLQELVIGPNTRQGVELAPQNRFEKIELLLISALNYDSTSIDVLVISRSVDGSQVTLRNGVDKNFIVRLGSSLIPILDSVPAEQLTGLAARMAGTGTSASTTTYFKPECSGSSKTPKKGVCQGPLQKEEGMLLTLRLVRPVAISKGRTRVFNEFELCPAGGGTGDTGGGGGQANASGANASRRLLQTANDSAGGSNDSTSGGNAAGGSTDDPSTCPAGKRHRIVTTGDPLFPPDMLEMAGKKPGGLKGHSVPDAAGVYTFPEGRRPIVIVRSRGRVAEVRQVKSVAGNVIELDADIEGNIYWPATVETTWDGKPHSCVPEHHSCVIPLYSVRLARDKPAYLPQDRYRARAGTEPTESPAHLDLELALFTVPGEVQGITAAAAPPPPPPGTPSPSSSAGAAGGDGGTGVLDVGAVGDTLCPKIPMTAAEMGVSKKFTAFNWGSWQVSGDRDFNVVSCLDRPIRQPDCKDLGEAAADSLSDTCLKAMPPTSVYKMVSTLPVNNKWVVPKTFLQIMRGVNLPEFDMDFSFVYNMQYSSETLAVEKDFAESMGTGDYLHTNNFTIYSGATEFQGLGAGFDGYRNLAQILPANHPVLSNTLVLGVDAAQTILDIKNARSRTSGAAASLWPQDEQDIKLLLERFDPLQIEWELSSIGGRSEEQVLVMQPGYEYLMEALLQIRPIYSSDVWETSRIVRWERQVVSTAASRTKLTDPAMAHQVVVRYHLEFDPLVRTQTFSKAYTVKVFVESVGAATGFIVLGAMILNAIRRVKAISGGGMPGSQDASQQFEFAQ